MSDQSSRDGEAPGTLDDEGFFGAETCTEQTAAPASQPTLTRGETAGRYVILEPLGKGGMGVVYQAYDPELDRRIALKLLHVSEADQSQSQAGRARDRLLREAQALAQLAHPNVVSAYDVGTIGDQIFVAMELVEGQTLTCWLKERAPSRAQIVKVLLAAGRGMAAAHQAGLIHRDFKPDNIIVGDDGRVRVLDFGLARAASLEPEESPAADALIPAPGDDQPLDELMSTGGSKKLLSSMTMRGSVVGTPGYMAPEQCLGQTVDEKSDQFAFGATLYFALYGKQAFSARTFRELKEKVTAGRIDPAPSGKKIPAWLRGIALRAMAVDPTQRYPSLEALLQELARDRRAKWQRLGAVAAMILLAATTVFSLLLWQGGKNNLCQGARAQLELFWNTQTQAEMNTAFAATNIAYAEDSRQRAVAALDDYAEAWANMKVDACQATHLRGEQSEHLLDLRMQCLERRRAELQALIAVFARADAQVVKKAATATTALTGLAACADLDALQERVPAPADPKQRRQLETMAGQLAEIKALDNVGKYAQALTQIAPLADQARRLAYLPIVFETRYRQGMLQHNRGQLEAAQASYFASLWASEAIGNDTGTVECLISMLRLYFDQENFSQAAQVGRRADALILRLHNPPRLRGLLLLDLARLAGVEAHFAEAGRLAAQSVTLLEKAFGPVHSKVASALKIVGSAVSYLGDAQQGLRHTIKALAITEQVHGPAHPAVASPLLTLGIRYSDLGEYQQSEALLRRALAIWERSKGPEHPDVAQVLVNLGLALRYQNHFDQAGECYQRSLDIFRQALGEDNSMVGFTYSCLGELALLAQQLPQARAWYQKSMAIDEKILGPKHPDLAYDLVGLGECHLESGQWSQARALLKRAHTLHQGDPVLLARIEFSLARALWQLRPQRPRARKLAQNAHNFFASRLPNHQADVHSVQNWLAQHPRP